MFRTLRNIGLVVIALTWVWPASAAIPSGDDCNVYYTASWLNLCDGPGSWMNCDGCTAYVCDNITEGGAGIIC